MKKILVVGAGFTGAVIAREMAEAGYEVDVIDKRNHIAGNAFDRKASNGIPYHVYGPHLFHTKNKRVWEYVTKFDSFTNYKHRVKALLPDGRFVTLPPNKETVESVGGIEKTIDTFFRPYTLKMWGRTLDELNPDIINRIKIRTDNNEFYFPDDVYQGLPVHGYTNLVKNVLKHENIEVFLDITFKKSFEKHYDHIFNSMPVDEYCNFALGKLEYRSIKFHHIPIPKYHLLPVATVNFTDDGKYTRVTDWSRLIPESAYTKHDKKDLRNNASMLTFEEPCDFRDNNDERYYPVKDLDGRNQKLYEKYKERVGLKLNMTFVGRCGRYVYIDMDQAINQALQISKKFITENT